MKRCGCGRVHTLIEWYSLPFVAVWAFDEGDPDLELRNCACDSTLAIELPVIRFAECEGRS